MIYYLAAPYGHPDPTIQNQRMKLFYKHDALLMKEGKFTVSPLAKVATAQHSDIPDTWDYWEQYSYELLARCDQMIVLKIDGWTTSRGVTAELEYCHKHSIPITFRDV